MAKDYAKKTRSSLVATEKARKFSLRSWVYSVLGFICVSGLIYLAAERKHILTVLQQSRMGSYVHKLAVLRVQAKQRLPASEAAKEDEMPVKFDFYSELPNMQINLPEASPSPAPVQSSVTNSTVNTTATAHTHVASAVTAVAGGHIPEVGFKNLYSLQIGLFSTAAAASQLRLSLLLAGFDADIVKEVKANGAILYHVKKGPYTSFTQVLSLQKRLNKQGIGSTIQRLPG